MKVKEKVAVIPSPSCTPGGKPCDSLVRGFGTDIPKKTVKDVMIQSVMGEASDPVLLIQNSIKIAIQMIKIMGILHRNLMYVSGGDFGL